MKREDLRVRTPWPDNTSYQDRPVSDAELAELIESMGYVRRPICGTCEGYKIDPESFTPATHLQPSEADPCPSCAGSGFDRLVALDGIDVEALRDELRYASDASQHSPVVRLGLAVLAALDKGEAE